MSADTGVETDGAAFAITLASAIRSLDSMFVTTNGTQIDIRAAQSFLLVATDADTQGLLRDIHDATPIMSADVPQTHSPTSTDFRILVASDAGKGGSFGTLFFNHYNLLQDGNVDITSERDPEDQSTFVVTANPHFEYTSYQFRNRPHGRHQYAKDI